MAVATNMASQQSVPNYVALARNSFSPIPPFALHYDYNIHKYNEEDEVAQDRVVKLPSQHRPRADNVTLPPIQPSGHRVQEAIQTQQPIMRTGVAQTSGEPFSQPFPPPPPALFPASAPLPPTGQPQAPVVQLVQPMPRNSPRVDALEDRLLSHERNTQTLMDRAFRVRDDIAQTLAHANWHDENQTRQLLQEHIHTITAVCKRLSRDIETIESQLNNRDIVLSSASSGIKNLEQHHVTGVLDLKGRVARCDAAIAQLSTQLRNAQLSINQLGQQLSSTGQELAARIDQLDSRIVELNSVVERNRSEYTSQLKSLQHEMHQQLGAMEASTRQALEEIKGGVVNSAKQEQAQREKGEGRLIQLIEELRKALEGRMTGTDERMKEWMEGTNHNIEQLHEGVTGARRKVSDLEQGLDNRIVNLVDPGTQELRTKLDKLKKDCKEGFKNVQDGMENMKAVQDGKRKLLQEQMKSEVGKVRKAVVLA